MGQLLTANAATNLYWLGRYIERINGILTNLIPAYDDTIDINKDAGKEYYKNFEVELTYSNAQEFLEEAMFGDHGSNLVALSGYARENAIISRSYINTEAFGEIIELHSIFKNVSKSYAMIDYKLINDALSLISEIWGEVSKIAHSNTSDYFLKLGRLVEKLDFHFRFQGEDEHSENVTESIYNILDILSAKNESEQIQQSREIDEDKYLIDVLHEKFQGLIVE
jgi:uncharacterized alpha-E superfamily protein